MTMKYASNEKERKLAIQEFDKKLGIDIIKLDENISLYNDYWFKKI